jgi:predicted nucleic acid-binding protein
MEQRSHFLDSSAVVKLYHPEAGSATIQKIFAEPESRILVSRLAVVEVRSALAGKLRMRAIAERDERPSLARFKSDLGRDSGQTSPPLPPPRPTSCRLPA